MAIPLRQRPQAPETEAPRVGRLLRHHRCLVGRRLLPCELPILLVLLLRAGVDALAHIAVGVDVGRFSVSLATDDLPRRQRLEMRDLLGRVRGLHLKSRGGEHPFSRPRVLRLQRGTSGQAERDRSEKQWSFHGLPFMIGARESRGIASAIDAGMWNSTTW